MTTQVATTQQAQAPATLDATYLAELQGMVNHKTSLGASNGPAVLKINYEVNQPIARGQWVVGQVKKDNQVIETGKRAVGLIVLTTRLQYNAYENKQPRNFYITTMYTWGSQCVDKHLVDAKAAELGLDKAQNRIVVFGLAICEDGEQVPCVAYMKGKTWMPFKEHLDAITKVQTANGPIEVPEYTFVTNFGEPITEQNGSNIYYVGVFERGNPLTPEQARECYKRAEEAHEYVDRQNQAKMERINGDQGGGQTTAPPVTAPPVANVPPVVGDDGFIQPDFTSQTVPSTGDDLPMHPAPAAAQPAVVQPAAVQPAAQPAPAPAAQPAAPAAQPAAQPAPAADSMADLEAEINSLL